MKLAFSTLGVPGMPVADVVRLASGHGYQGVELRAHPEEPVHPGLGPAERAAVADEFKRGGVEILNVAGYAKVAAAGDDEPVLAELAGLVQLAHDLGAPYVRVFPGGGDPRTPPRPTPSPPMRLGAAAPQAADLGVRILLETHDSHRAGADVARVVGTVGHGQIGAIWDVMHTWLAGEEAGREPCRAGAAPGVRPVQGHRVGRGHHAARTRHRGAAPEGVPGHAGPGQLGLLGVREALVPRGCRPAGAADRRT